MLSAVAESVVGPPVIRAYGVAGDRAAAGPAIEENRRAQIRAQRLQRHRLLAGELAAGLALAAVVVVGVHLGVGGAPVDRQLTAFLFLVALFIAPVQMAAEVLNEAQNAVAGWRRVLDMLDLGAGRGRPGRGGVDLPAGPIDVRFGGALRLPGRPGVLPTWT